MVEIVVDPGLDGVFDVGEVDDHASIVGFVGLDVYFNSTVVAVQVPTFAFVVEEAVTVAEVNDSGYFVRHYLNASDVTTGVHSNYLAGD